MMEADTRTHRAREERIHRIGAILGKERIIAASDDLAHAYIMLGDRLMELGKTFPDISA